MLFNNMNSLSIYFQKVDLQDPTCLIKFDEILSSNSYICGHVPCQIDVQLCEHLKEAVIRSYVNLSRWYFHMTSFSSEEKAHMVNLGGTGIDAKLLICDQVDKKVSSSINCYALVIYFVSPFYKIL